MSFRNHDENTHKKISEVFKQVGKTIIDIGNEIEKNEEIDLNRLIIELEKSRENLINNINFYNIDTNNIKRLKNMLSNKGLFPTKNSYFEFLKIMYNEEIPKKWNTEKIIYYIIKKGDTKKRLVELINYIDNYKYRDQNFKPIPQHEKINVYEMDIDSIKRELIDINKYPDVNSIKQAISGDLKKILKGVEKRETAIKKIIEEVERTRGYRRLGEIYNEGV